MRKFKFLGTEAFPDSISVRGVNFETGKATQIEDEALCSKLLGMGIFEEVKRGRKAKDDKDSA